MERILGTDLSIELSGQDRACALIFLHGGGGSRSDWVEQVRHFKPNYRVVAIDLPGHGDSSVPKDATIEYLAACALEARARFGCPRNVIFGHSLGCWVALAMHLRDPLGDAGIVLIEGNRLAYNEGQAEALKATVRELGGRELLRRRYRQMFTTGTDPSLVQNCLARVERLNDKFITDIVLSTIDWDLKYTATALQNVTVPILLIQSTTADLRSLSRAEDSVWIRFAQTHACQAGVELISNAGHFPHLADQPGIVNTIIGNFLGRLSSSGT
jgi:pimeloyl-ACP methyl ester carboxylesterase